MVLLLRKAKPVLCCAPVVKIGQSLLSWLVWELVCNLVQSWGTQLQMKATQKRKWQHTRPRRQQSISQLVPDPHCDCMHVQQLCMLGTSLTTAPLHRMWSMASPALLDKLHKQPINGCLCKVSNFPVIAADGSPSSNPLEPGLIR
jgi:hypothetical protein